MTSNRNVEAIYSKSGQRYRARNKHLNYSKFGKTVEAGYKDSLGREYKINTSDYATGLREKGEITVEFEGPYEYIRTGLLKSDSDGISLGTQAFNIRIPIKKRKTVTFPDLDDHIVMYHSKTKTTLEGDVASKFHERSAATGMIKLDNVVIYGKPSGEIFTETFPSYDSKIK